MRVIFSIYIDFDEKDFEVNMDLNKNIRNKNKFKTYYSFLKNKQIEYAKTNNVDYILYENNNRWKSYKTQFETNYPYVSKYNIVNFYKIQLMYDLCEKYDEILYLDFDVVPLTSDNIFNNIDLTKGIACKINHEGTPGSYFSKNHQEAYFLKTGSMHFSERSPFAKYWNCKAMLIENDLNGDNDVYNTGIILANKCHLQKLKYFKDFDKTLKYMNNIKNDKHSMWPNYIQKTFGYDNETLFSYKMKSNNINLINLNDEWHFTFSRTKHHIPKKTKMVHIINKNFKYVEEYVKKNNL